MEPTIHLTVSTRVEQLCAQQHAAQIVCTSTEAKGSRRLLPSLPLVGYWAPPLGLGSDLWDDLRAVTKQQERANKTGLLVDMI